MIPSSVLCRTQEALHRSRAAETPLANVRRVAEAAAAAWGQEATIAERREKRHREQLAATEDSRRQTAQQERSSSENPDRGFADQ